MTEGLKVKTPHTELTLEEIAGMLPGTSDVMARVADAWWKCAYAARGGNWPLAAYFAGRVRTLQRGLALVRPKYREQLAGFDKAELAAVIAAVKKRDREEFERAFAAATERANELHAETSHAYIRWVLPDQPPRDLVLSEMRAETATGGAR